jgi:hypothetical protein
MSIETVISATMSLLASLLQLIPRRLSKESGRSSTAPESQLNSSSSSIAVADQ